VAVIIVTFRTAELTINALESLAGERNDPRIRIRAVVVDNASGDARMLGDAIASRRWSSWVTLLVTPRNGGFAYGNNRGIEYAYGVGAPEYLYLLNPDAQVRPGAISALVRFLESRPDVGVAGSSFENLDGTDWPIAFRFPTVWSEIDAGLKFGLVTRLLRRWVVAVPRDKIAQEVDWICGASMLIRPEVIAAIGGLDENYFLYFEETDFCHRAREAGYPTWYVPQSRVMHIAGQSTQVTDLTRGRRRLPSYWFESRRRYFATRFGLRYAMVTDLVALLAHSIGSVKRVAIGRSASAVPHYLEDLLRHSIIWPKNRNCPPVIAYRPHGRPE
jgi:GT2 family glycosyltransferase